VAKVDEALHARQTPARLLPVNVLRERANADPRAVGKRIDDGTAVAAASEGQVVRQPDERCRRGSR
jgi:hypothetical protein